MTRLRSNSVCPCGSGKKFRDCCSAIVNDPAYQDKVKEHVDQLILAMNWLTMHYDDASYAATDDFFFGHRREHSTDFFFGMPHDQTELLHFCMDEWLIGNARIHLRRGDDGISASELLFAPDGPKFTEGGAWYIRELAASELSLYEVLKVYDHQGVLLRDMVRPDAAPVFVVEKRGTERLSPGDTLGARVLRGDRGCGLFSICVCELERGKGRKVADAIVAAIKEEGRKKRQSRPVAEIVASFIIDAWLDELRRKFIADPPQTPVVLDGKTQEPLVCTMDTYHVSDWEALADILDDQDDVVILGSREWVRIEPMDMGPCEGMDRTLATLRRLSSGMLAVECHSEGGAKAADRWLKRLAGPLLTRGGKVVENFFGQTMEGGVFQEDLTEPDRGMEAGPAERLEEKLSELLRGQWESWLSMPIPALNGKTPLQAARFKTYRPKLVKMLKKIEKEEAALARTMGVAGFDTGFLWERLGLAREQ